MKANLAYMDQRSPDGQLSGRDHPLHHPLIVESAEEIKSCFDSGGAGCFAKPQEYTREFPRQTLRNLRQLNVIAEISATLLKGGTFARIGQRIMQKQSVDEMFRNQITRFPTSVDKAFRHRNQI